MKINSRQEDPLSLNCLFRHGWTLLNDMATVLFSKYIVEMKIWLYINNNTQESLHEYNGSEIVWYWESKYSDNPLALPRRQCLHLLDSNHQLLIQKPIKIVLLILLELGNLTHNVTILLAHIKLAVFNHPNKIDDPPQNSFLYEGFLKAVVLFDAFEVAMGGAQDAAVLTEGFVRWELGEVMGVVRWAGMWLLRDGGVWGRRRWA